MRVPHRNGVSAARSNRFYRDVLGAEIVPIGTGFSDRFGDTQLNCHGPSVQGTPKAALPVQPGGSDLCFIWPDQIDSALTHLSMHGVKVEVGPVKRFGSGGHGTRVYFRDPDGSLMELISYVDAPADA